MEIIYHDDKKEKYQSVTASVASCFSSPMGNADFNITGYGATAREAKEELLKMAKMIIDDIRSN